MLEICVFITAAVVVLSMMAGYQRTKDPLCPVIVFGPLLAYVYVYSPATLMWTGTLARRFKDDDLTFVGLINLIGVSAFCLGLISYSAPRGWAGRTLRLPQFQLAEQVRTQILSVARLLGTAAVLGFAYLVYVSGGPVHVFTRPKPFLFASSGYLGELPMLSLPALLLMAIAMQGKRLNVRHYLVALLVTSPHLVMGTMGGRRGAAFLAVCSLVVCWYLVHNKRPSTRVVLCGVVATGLFMLFLASNRQNVYIGSNKSVDIGAFWQQVTLQEKESSRESGQEFVVGAGTIVASAHHRRFFWGRRFLAQVLVRPIPRQIWPTKYEDIGMGWMARSPGTFGFSTSEWYEACGFAPHLGSSIGMVADLFLEFSYASPFFCYAMGRLYSVAWYRWLTRGRFWSLVYFAMIALSAHLAAQSMIAWIYRVLILVVPAWILWWAVLGRSNRHRVTHRVQQRLPERIERGLS